MYTSLAQPIYGCLYPCPCMSVHLPIPGTLATGCRHCSSSAQAGLLSQGPFHSLPPQSWAPLTPQGCELLLLFSAALHPLPPQLQACWGKWGGQAEHEEPQSPHGNKGVWDGPTGAGAMPWGSLGPMPLGEVPRLPFLCPLQACKCRSQASRDSSTGHLEVRQDSQSFPHRSWKGRMGFKVAGSQGEHTWMRLPPHTHTHTRGLLVLEMRRPGPSNNQRKWASQQSIVTCPARPPPPLPLPTMRLHQPCTWALRAEGSPPSHPTTPTHRT